MVKSVQICTAGECGGECYRCRLAAVATERDQYARTMLRLYDVGIISGRFGPGSDGWTEEDSRMWSMLDDLQKRFGMDGQ